MATRKKARAKVTAKRPVKKSARKAVTKAKAKAKAPVKRKGTAPAAKRRPALKARRLPETLRLKSFTPSLTVNDLARSLAFYEGALGFFVSQRWTDGDVLRGVMLKAGASELAISQDDWKMGKERKKGEGFSVWCNTSQDIDAIASRLKSAGFALTDEPTDHTAWGVRSLSVDDPDGFHLTIARNL